MVLNCHNSQALLPICVSFLQRVSCASTVDGGVIVYVMVCFSLVTVNTKTVSCLCQQGDNHQPYR